MKLIKSAQDYPMSAIFATDQKIQYQIPLYQREYVWGKDEWEKFLGDIKENGHGYFIGSIICVNQGSDVLADNPVEIIDGQQRLTTISLLYAAIYSKLVAQSKSDEEFVTEKTNLRYRLVQKGGQKPKLGLSEQGRNQEDYLAILAELGLCAQAKKPDYLGVRRIYRAYQHLKSGLPDDYAELIDLLGHLNSATVVKIEVSNSGDAYILFESLNNRGIPLSAMDIIKNKILFALQKKTGKVPETQNTEWLSLTEHVGDYSDQFLRHYYNAFRYDPKLRVEGYSKAIRSNLIKVYEHLIDKDPMLIFDDLMQKAKTYSVIVDPTRIGPKEAKATGLTNLLHVGATSSYILLLYLMSRHKDDKALIGSTIDFLVKYFARRNLTGFPVARV